MTSVGPADGVKLDLQVPLLIIGAGAAGLCAALAANEAGIEPLVIERDKVPSGSTALSAGLIPAAGTRFQRAKNIEDSAELFAGDIQRKAHGEADSAVVAAVAQGSAATVEWLADRYGLPFDVIDNFNYPGHSAMRMHGLPTRSGQELIDRLRSAAEASGISIVTERVANRLLADADGAIRGVEIMAGDGGRERIGCGALILACNGYGGNPDLVRRYIPEMANALYFGHPGNRGDAVLWGGALGAQLKDLGAYQGHGSVATPHNILISWATVMQGGFQVNRDGVRFCDESQGYSEQAAQVLRQPDGIAWTVFDARIADIARQFEDYRAAERTGAIVSADSLQALATAMHVPAAPFAAAWSEVEALKARDGSDRFGRQFAAAQLFSPFYHAVKVTGALFHTQGGLDIDAHCHVLHEDASPFKNLLAAGGAARGVSGNAVWGYLSG
ncbi:MAG: FAD-dependent oxidoreductase, partial [Hyphomicrobium sp.]|nr:FAD-dependent oxidoreductase [Hyphomicrobium sp.]